MGHEDGACSCGGGLENKVAKLTEQVDALKASLSQTEDAQAQLKNELEAAQGQVRSEQEQPRLENLDLVGLILRRGQQFLEGREGPVGAAAGQVQLGPYPAEA